MRKYIYKFKWQLVRPSALARWRDIYHNEILSLDELLNAQEVARQHIVMAAMNFSPFYRRFFKEHGFNLADIGKDNWFERLPVVKKSHIREYFDEFINPAKRMYLKISTTGGSTGTPVKTGYDGRIPEEIYSWRLQSWFGVNPWDDHAYVWRDTRNSRLAKLKNAALWWPTKHLKMDAAFITEKGTSDFIEKYNAKRGKKAEKSFATLFNSKHKELALDF